MTIDLTCSFRGCTRRHSTRGLCLIHSRQLIVKGELTPLPPENAPKRFCTFEDCNRPHKSNGLCAGHYHQKWRGEELRPLRKRISGVRYEKDWNRVPLEEKLKAFTRRDDDMGCLLWTGPTTHTGYGTVTHEGSTVLAHRAAYMHWVGPIPEGLVLDHICGNRGCVEPTHLRAVTPSENSQYLTTLRSSNSSGHSGVHYDKANRKWSAKAYLNRKCHWVGQFDTAKEAGEALMKYRDENFSMGDPTLNKERLRKAWHERKWSLQEES